MRGNNLRGGVGEYKINDVLGTRFQNFMDLVDQQKLTPFLVRNLDASLASATGSPYGLDDLHPDFAEYVMAVSAALRQIESPELTKVQVTGKYGNALESIVNDLFSGTTSGLIAQPTQPFGFNQLPFHNNHPNIKHLIPGFHLFPYTSAVYPTVNQNNNALINAILYLYHYISLLDLDSGVDARNIVSFLKKDNLVFNRYVNDIVTTMTNNNFFSQSLGFPTGQPTDEIVRDSVLQGLTGVAYQIVNRLRNVQASNQTFANLGAVAGQDISAKDAFAKFVSSVATPGYPGVNADKLFDAFSKITGGFYDQGPDVVNIADVDNDQAKQYRTNGLLNPVYILSPSIAKTVNADDYDKLNQAGGKRNSSMNNSTQNNNSSRSNNSARNNNSVWNNNNSAWKNNNSAWNDNSSWKNNNRFGQAGGITFGDIGAAPAGSVLSLPFLYGPALPDGSHKLITEDEQGDQNDAKLVDIDSVKEIEDLTDPNNITGIIPEIVDIGNDPNYNYARAQLVTLLYQLIVNEATFDQASGLPNLDNEIRNAAQNYNKIVVRLRAIPTSNFGSSMADLRDSFLSEFVNTSYRQFQVEKQTGNLITGQQTIANKGSNFANPDIKSFYDNTLVNNADFYKTYFNLVKLGPNGVVVDADVKDITEAKGKSDAELQNYRLNVRKNTGYTRFTGAQVGGLLGDIVFIDRIPAFPQDGSIRNVWLTRAIALTPATLNAYNVEALRRIAREVYNSPVGQSTVPVYGQPVDLTLIAQSAARMNFPISNVAFRDTFNNLLQNALNQAATGTAVTPGFIEQEDKLVEHLLRVSSRWERDGNTFIFKDLSGNPVQTDPADNCLLIDTSTRECLSVLTQCIADPGTKLSDTCARLMEFNFKVNPPLNLLKDEISKMNPGVAFEILRKFGFGSYLAEDKDDSGSVIRRYKVQSVGSWIRELMGESARCAPGQAPVVNQGPCRTISLREELGQANADKILNMAKDSAPFLRYLEVLVHWVNANPQVLNPEETKDQSTLCPTSYPKVNDSFNTYSYLNPYKDVVYRLRNTTCDLERLKCSIMGNYLGSGSRKIFTDLATIPHDTNMPFTRIGFTSTVPLLNKVPMFGGDGGIYNLQNQLNNLNNPVGYNMFHQIYKDLLNTMGNIGDSRCIRLSSNTQARCEDKLESFKNAEIELNKCLNRLIERNKIYQATRGRIDLNRVPPENVAAVLEKHSNLLNMNSAYNKKAVNLIDIFQTIAKAIINKVEEGAPKQTVERPLTMGFHNPSYNF
ncbi:hypothetical protein HIRU_S511 [Hirudovirus strain Sangsue]|nr:hypothetical protein HIRU_S511 [Hirudovirus strain Sangsue]